MERAQNERVQPRVKKRKAAAVAVVVASGEEATKNKTLKEGNKAERRSVGAGVAVEPENELATYMFHPHSRPRERPFYK